MPRLPALLVMLALLVPAPAAALAQGGGPFGPLPPPQPVTTPSPEPQDAGTSGDVSRQTLFLLGLGVILTFVGIGWAITRDARRSLTEDDRAVVDNMRAAGTAPRKQDMAKMKERQRAKTRAQRQARKKTRRANRG
jgi:hypothetical protein